MADPSRLYGLKALVINAAGGINGHIAATNDHDMLAWNLSVSQSHPPQKVNRFDDLGKLRLSRNI